MTTQTAMQTAMQPANSAVEDQRRLVPTGDHEAIAAGWDALRNDPRNPDLLARLGLAEHRRGNTSVGVVLLQRAVKASPVNPALWNDLGNLYFSAGAMGEAEAAYRRALALDDQCAEGYNNLAVLFSKRGDHAAARALLDRALDLRPQYADALYNMGNALAGLGKFQKALRRYEQARALTPDHPGTHFNLGITRLVLGDLSGGWPEWEWRWRSTLAPFKREFRQPAWTGAPLQGKRLLLYAEQGIGDTIQFLRYLPLVAAKGAEIVLEVPRPLVRLLQAYPRVTKLIARGDALPQFDAHCSLMSLGAVFRTTLANIPEGRLKFGAPAPPETHSASKRVGIVWAGNPTHERDNARSMRLSDFQPIFDLPRVEWFSLQKGGAASQLEGDFPVCDLGAGFVDFADTAAAIASLDLVITVDTSVAHLAGAMGKPVWILLPAIPDWRWLLKRRDSPWYPTARLFRQSAPGDWPGVIACVRAELSVLAAQPSLLRLAAQCVP